MYYCKLDTPNQTNSLMCVSNTYQYKEDLFLSRNESYQKEIN